VLTSEPVAWSRR